MSKHSDYDLPKRKYDFHTDLKFGKEGEALVNGFLDSIQAGAFEVKTDRYRNGRMVIETEQNPRRRQNPDGTPLWQPSGLMVTKAAWWAYVYTLDGTQGAFIMVSVPRLKRYLSAHPELFNSKTIITFARTSSNPSKGYLLYPDQVMDLMTNKEYDEVRTSEETE